MDVQDANGWSTAKKLELLILYSKFGRRYLDRWALISKEIKSHTPAQCAQAYSKICAETLVGRGDTPSDLYTYKVRAVDYDQHVDQLEQIRQSIVCPGLVQPVDRMRYDYVMSSIATDATLINLYTREHAEDKEVSEFLW